MNKEKLSNKSKEKLIKVFNQFYIKENNINAYYFNFKSDELNERLIEIKELGILE